MNVVNALVQDWARDYSDEKFHALLCDPPYHLTSITKRFGKPNSKPAKGGVYARASRGFMNTRWDGGGVAFEPETWAALGEHLHSGAFGMAFASSRGWHRMAVAIEDAGFVIHPSIFMLGYAFGSGFPKATRIDTQVDKAAGTKGKPSDYKPNMKNDVYGRAMGGGTTTQQYLAATPLAATWESHRYGLQALKPAVEPIIVFQKPYEGKPVDSITRTGAGALNIDGGRIGTEIIQINEYRNSKAQIGITNLGGVSNAGEKYTSKQSLGRWPANFVLTHLPECNGVCADGCAVKALGEQSGESKSSSDPNRFQKTSGGWKNQPYGNQVAIGGDSGTAARFFFQAQYEQIDAAEPVYYTAKAGRKERDAGLDAMPLKKHAVLNAMGNDPQGEIDEVSQRFTTQKRNPHPTIKPISLTRYLATLLLPPAAYAPRRLLVPFAGTGSEMIGAFRAGWEYVEGVEGESEYCAIARARLAHWCKQPAPLDGSHA